MIRKKEFSLETWEEETSNTISLKKNNEKAEKYYTNEGTNQKHRSPNKLRGNRKITKKRIQNDDSKDDQNLENRMDKMYLISLKCPFLG